MSKQINVAIDGNEANIENRVGSNVYAFELLSALEKITRDDQSFQATILLRSEPIEALPPEREGWTYRTFGPKKLWTQWALPLHLFARRKEYDLFFSPGHYAPHICPLPYVSSVMDTAYLDFPDHFTEKDRLQLTNWTEKAASKARKVIVISEATKVSVKKHYHRAEKDLVVAYPAFSLDRQLLNKTQKADFFKQHAISEPYLLFVGTIQPRKNLEVLIEAFEIFSRMIASRTLAKKKSRSKSPGYQPAKLVLAGKIGWLSDPIIKRIESSPMSKRIIQTGFVTEAEKQTLYKNAFASVLIGLHEGFGIPPLESMSLGTPVIVSNNTSLPEVVGAAGMQVDPTNPQAVAEAIWNTYTMTSSKLNTFRKQAKKQLESFSWEKSASTVLETLRSVVDNAGK